VITLIDVYIILDLSNPVKIFSDDELISRDDASLFIEDAKRGQHSFDIDNMKFEVTVLVRFVNPVFERFQYFIQSFRELL
jgi:hypothetical protein